jgi:hypothetical protein
MKSCSRVFFSNREKPASRIICSASSSPHSFVAHQSLMTINSLFAPHREPKPTHRGTA